MPKRFSGWVTVAGVLGRLDVLRPSGCGQVSDLPFFLLLFFSLFSVFCFAKY
jgi:hypothetical protein